MKKKQQEDPPEDFDPEEEKAPPMWCEIKNNEFVGVKFDPKAVTAVGDIAQGLIENARACIETAKALGKLAEVFRNPHMSLNSMLSIGQDVSCVGVMSNFFRPDNTMKPTGGMIQMGPSAQEEEE